MSRPPERIVTTGPYVITRNPMYMGHVIFLTGLALTTRSRTVAAATLLLLPWFDARARGDEEALLESFGTEYEHYREAVPRWVSLVPVRRR